MEQKMTFEEVLERLRQITEKMEDPGMPLAEALHRKKEGNCTDIVRRPWI